MNDSGELWYLTVNTPQGMGQTPEKRKRERDAKRAEDLAKGIVPRARRSGIPMAEAGSRQSVYIIGGTINS